MPYKDPDKQRTFAREWARKKKAWLSDEARARKRQWRAKQKSLGIAERRSPRKPAPKPPQTKEHVKYDPILNRMIVITED